MLRAVLGAGALGLFTAACCRPAPGRATAFSAAEIASASARAARRAPPGFTVVSTPPFVVIGDGPLEGVREDAESVVRWAGARLRAETFALDPGEIVEVWLFSGEESTLRNTSAIFGETPTTPYGYYSPCDRALIMNVALGYGTLVHEMVHAFMAANFPAAPVWFNEGLASLYEQPSERDGHIRGGTNWRLPGLQDAIRAGRVPALADLLATSSRAFYGDGRGTRYAAARYLCYFLQEKGLLVRYYHRFVAAQARDPTGLATLKEVTGEVDLSALQARWEAFVLGLSYARGRP